jgi:hypothetical protein
MGHYHQPIKPPETKQNVFISGYCINQKTKFDDGSRTKESQLTVELTFLSNDFSPAKYEEFLIKFQGFLNENF